LYPGDELIRELTGVHQPAGFRKNVSSILLGATSDLPLIQRQIGENAGDGRNVFAGGFPFGLWPRGAPSLPSVSRDCWEAVIAAMECSMFSVLRAFHKSFRTATTALPAAALYWRCLRALLMPLVCGGMVAGIAPCLSAQTAEVGASLTVVYSGEPPEGLTIDSAGNVYSGFDTGIGIYKSTYNNGSYTTTSIGGPQDFFFGLTIDANGVIYAADEGTGNIYKIVVNNDGSYTFTPIISIGTITAGVAVDGYGNIYTNNYGSTLYKYIYDSSNATYIQYVIASNFEITRNLAVDPNGVIYQADEGTSEVRVFTPVGQVATTTTYTEGTPFTGATSTSGVAVKNGIVYIGDQTQLLQETPNGSGGYTQTVLASGFAGVRGIAPDNSGNIFVADLDNERIDKITNALQDFGSVQVGTTSTAQPVTFDIITGGTLGTPAVVTQGASGQDFAISSGTTCSGAVTAGASCVVYVTFTPQAAGERYGAVELTNSSGAVIVTALVQGNGSAPQVTETPGTIQTNTGGVTLNGNQSVVADVLGNLYVADTNANVVYKISGSSAVVYAGGGSGGDGGPATSASLNQPTGLALDGAGNVYIAEAGSESIREVSATTGLISTVAGGTGFSSLNSMAIDGEGNLYISDAGANKAIELLTTGVQQVIAGTGTAGFSGDTQQATAAQLNGPSGIGVDGTGNVYVADTANQRIREITLNGIINTIAGSSSTAGYGGDGGPATSALLSGPSGQITIDAAGDVYFNDTGNNRVRMISAATQILSTVAGGATGSGLGDGGPATAATLSAPLGLAMDSAGNLYIGDTGHNRLREVTAAAAPLTFASTVVGSTSADSPQTVTVNNIGNEVLTIPAPGTGFNPSISTDFTLNGTGTHACPQIGSGSSAGALNAGQNCQLAISFSPTSAGTISGSIVLTDNALNTVTSGVGSAQQSISLSGTGTQPDTTTTALSASATTIAEGEPVRLTAVVSDATHSATTPTGPVSFIDTVGTTATTLATVSLSGGTATDTVALSTAGTHTITANYAGVSGSFLSSTSNSFTVTVVAQIQPTIRWTQPGAITYGTSLASVLNAAAINGTNTVPGTYSYLNGTTAVSGSTILSAGSYTLTVNFAPTDTSVYKTATGSIVLTVNKAGVSVVALTSTLNPVLVENTTTFIATVSSPASAPTGSVNFFDGSSSTPLGTAMLSGGVAQLPVSTLAAGTHSIKAVYSGNGNFLGAASAALSEQVGNFNLMIETSGSGSGTADPSAAVTPGGTAKYSFSLTPTGVTTFPSAVTLRASGLPPGATYTITPSTIAAKAGPTKGTLSISVPSRSAALQNNEPFRGGLVPVALGMLLLPFSRGMWRSASRMGRLTVLFLLIAAAAGTAGLTGCGAGTGFFAQPQQTYKVTVTATSGALTHSTTATLTVQ
jgi:large repetitive protein